MESGPRIPDRASRRWLLTMEFNDLNAKRRIPDTVKVDDDAR